MDAQELRNLQEAYVEVVMNEGDVDSPYDRAQTNRADAYGRAQTNRADAYGRAQKKKKEKTQKEEAVDLYDIILSHLLDEGYADTQEAAEAIMVNMSEEWREDIMEISDKRVMAARNALAKRTDKSVGGGDGNQYSKNVSREARMNARIQSRNQRTGSNVEPTFTRRHQ